MSDKTAALIDRARLEAPHSDDGTLLRQLADALEAATVNEDPKAKTCNECGRKGGFMASASRGGETRYFCHNDERSCYNIRRGKYFDGDTFDLDEYIESWAVTK